MLSTGTPTVISHATLLKHTGHIGQFPSHRLGTSGLWFPHGGETTPFGNYFRSILVATFLTGRPLQLRFAGEMYSMPSRAVAFRCTKRREVEVEVAAGRGRPGNVQPFRFLYACNFASGARDTAQSITSWLAT